MFWPAFRFCIAVQLLAFIFAVKFIRWFVPPEIDTLTGSQQLARLAFFLVFFMYAPLWAWDQANQAERKDRP